MLKLRRDSLALKNLMGMAVDAAFEVVFTT
jgi:hypothetical protein